MYMKRDPQQVQCLQRRAGSSYEILHLNLDASGAVIKHLI